MTSVSHQMKDSPPAGRHSPCTACAPTPTPATATATGKRRRSATTSAPAVAAGVAAGDTAASAPRASAPITGQRRSTGTNPQHPTPGRDVQAEQIRHRMPLNLTEDHQCGQTGQAGHYRRGDHQPWPPRSPGPRVIAAQIVVHPATLGPLGPRRHRQKSVAAATSVWGGMPARPMCEPGHDGDAAAHDYEQARPDMPHSLPRPGRRSARRPHPRRPGASRARRHRGGCRRLGGGGPARRVQTDHPP